jgi:hypothetical protein
MILLRIRPHLTSLTSVVLHFTTFPARVSPVYLDAYFKAQRPRVAVIVDLERQKPTS